MFILHTTVWASTRGDSAGTICRRAWEDIRGLGRGSLCVGEEKPGLGVEGRQAHCQDSGNSLEEAAREDLLLSRSWQTRTIRTANHIVCNLCNWLGRSQDPSIVAGPARFLSDQPGGESGWSPKRNASESLRWGWQTGLNRKVPTFFLKELQRLGPPPRSSSKMASRAKLERTRGKVLVCSLAQGQITSRPSPRSSPVQLRAAHLLRLPLTLQPGRVGNTRSAALFAQLGPLTKSDLKSYSISGPCQK